MTKEKLQISTSTPLIILYEKDKIEFIKVPLTFHSFKSLLGEDKKLCFPKDD